MMSLQPLQCIMYCLKCHNDGCVHVHCNHTNSPDTWTSGYIFIYIYMSVVVHLSCGIFWRLPLYLLITCFYSCVVCVWDGINVTVAVQFWIYLRLNKLYQSIIRSINRSHDWRLKIYFTQGSASLLYQARHINHNSHNFNPSHVFCMFQLKLQ